MKRISSFHKPDFPLTTHAWNQGSTVLFSVKSVAILFCERNSKQIFFLFDSSCPAVVLKFVNFFYYKTGAKIEGTFSISRSDKHLIVRFYSFSTIKLLCLSDISISGVLGTSYICSLFIN